MFQRFHEKLQDREEGFTLIELLVVILIIAILAAIAIPVFLAQREKGWVSQAESALKNAATAQESFLVANGDYAAAGPSAVLEPEGFNQTADVTVTITDATQATEYCLTAVHANLTAPDDTFHYDSEDGEPTTGPCV